MIEATRGETLAGNRFYGTHFFGARARQRRPNTPPARGSSSSQGRLGPTAGRLEVVAVELATHQSF